jgi:hypothetical protein
MVARAQEGAWSAERCARLLSKPKKSPTGWKACCPAHEDSEPSLFLADGDDGLALVCYAGCDYRNIVQALEAKGAVVNPSHDRSIIPAEHFQLGGYHSYWDYRDASGRLLMRICRWEQPDGKKDIRPLIRDIDGWKWGHHPNPRPLFQLDRLANEPDAPVIITEGEKTASAAQKLFPEHVSTTWPGGAQAMGQADWSPLTGRTVVIVPDCDSPGRKAMAWVVQHLKAVAQNVRVVDPGRLAKDLPKGWDLADALYEGRDVSQWLLPEKAPPPRLIELGFTVKEACAHTDLPYLVKEMFDRGQVIVLWGAPGSGKTFVALHLASHIGAGLAWAGRRVKRGIVFYICAESTRKRLENRVIVLREKYPELTDALVFFVPVQLNLLSGASDLEDVLAACKALESQMGEQVALIVVDTLSVTFGGGDENGPEDMGLYVSNIKRLKDITGAAVLIVHHSGKDESRGMRGHSALLGALDAELIVEKLDATPGWPSRMLKSGKLREGQSNADIFPFDLEVRSLGLDPDGDVVSTCVVMPASVSAERLRRPSVGTQAKLLSALERAHRGGQPVWTDKEIREIAKAHMGRNAITQAILALADGGFLRQSVGGFILASPPELRGQP